MNDDSIQVRLAQGLLPTQDAFYHSKATRKLYIGPVGSGKSEVGARCVASLLYRRPGNRALVGRLRYKDFQKSTLFAIERVFSKLILRYVRSESMMIVRSRDPNAPSYLDFAHFDEPEQYGSVEVGVIWPDEIGEVPYSTFEFLETRLRLKGVEQYYMLGTGNPCGHDAYWRAFHPDSPDRRPGYEWFSPRPYENAANLPERYYQDLEERHGAEWVSRYVLGSSDVFEGQVYPMLREDLHRWPDDSIPDPPPAHWPRIVALDHGFRNPTAVGFYCVDGDGVMWCYDEHHKAGELVPHHAEVIKRKVKRHCVGCPNVEWVADPSIFYKTGQKNGRAWSIFDEYSEFGLDDWEPGENDLRAGYDRVAQLLRTGKLRFLRRCRHHWDEMVRLHWKRPVGDSTDQRLREEAADVDDHCPDELRYAVMTRPDSAPSLAPPRAQTHAEHRSARVALLARRARIRARNASRAELELDE